jgi:hypothetical protein
MSNKSHQHNDDEEYNELEKNEVIADLKTMDPISNYRIKSTEDYSVNIIKDKISLKSASTSLHL